MLRKTHPRADRRWHLDEGFVSIDCRNMCRWRAVHCEGEVLDVLLQSRWKKRAALKLMRKLLKSQGFTPVAIVTDKLPLYGATMNDLGIKPRHIIRVRASNWAENSHLQILQREQGFAVQWRSLRHQKLRYRRGVTESAAQERLIPRWFEV